MTPSPITYHPSPSGAVTFLFTDIEGSTRLWERDAAVMWRALERHNAILGEAIAAHGGHHFKTIGDAVQAAFADPADAIAAAVAAQRTLAAEPWAETGPLRVRMALHRGPAEPSPTGDYLAPSLNRLARLLAAGHGGQVLLSTAMHEALGARLPDGATLTSLGRHRLRDLLAAEEIWQLVIPGLPATFPPLKSLEGFATNLPQQPTPLIGREADTATLHDLLADEQTRLLTLTGPGGVGKTRLALAAAADSLETFTDGVFLVALAGIGDASLLLPEIAAVLGVREGGGLTLAESVRAYLSGKRLLLVLDNLEQLRPFDDAAAMIANLLEGTPGVRVLTTSRAPLRVRAEREWPVAPFPTPVFDLGEEAAGEAALAALAANPAVALFVERARAARPAWRITAANAADVAEIARRLEGLPLAIELAAARVRVLTPAEIVKRLGGALDLLAARAGDRPDRQQTLRGAIAWSHDLLSFEHQAAFRRLGVFSGGFTLEAAEAVLAAAPAPWIDALDAIAILAEQSMLRAEEDTSGETRYRMLETIRAFALEQLDGAGEGEALRRAHATWAEAFARGSTEKLLGADGPAWLDRYEREHDNFRAAIAWSIAHDPGNLGLRLPDSLWQFWDSRGHYAEARGWLEQAFNACHDAPAVLKAQVLQRLGAIAWRQGNLLAAERELAESVDLWRTAGDKKALARALTNLGIVADMQGDPRHAQALLEEAFSLVKEAGDQLELASALNNLALVIWSRGDVHRATALMEESVSIRRRERNWTGLAGSLNNLGMLAAETGDLEHAIALLEEALSIERELGNPPRIADLLGTLAGFINQTGDLSRAAALSAEALELQRAHPDPLGLAYSLESTAAIATRARLLGLSSRLLGAADRLREELRAPLPPPERAGLDEQLRLLREELDETSFQEAWVAGRSLSSDDAILEALVITRRIVAMATSGAER